jgi:hypothetical protein
MTVERGLRMIAGTVILVSMALAHFVSPYWYLLTAFVGLNLLQSAFTNWCPAMVILGKLGLKSCEASPRLHRSEVQTAWHGRRIHTPASAAAPLLHFGHSVFATVPATLSGDSPRSAALNGSINVRALSARPSVHITHLAIAYKASRSALH